MIRHPGLWTRFWLFIGCISYEYTDDRHWPIIFSSYTSRTPSNLFAQINSVSPESDGDK